MNPRGLSNINRAAASFLFSVLTGVFLILIQVLPAIGQEEQKKDTWKGKLADGATITEGDLSKILEEHKKWVNAMRPKGFKGQSREGKKANLAGADLAEADLHEANLTLAYLKGADLSSADLSGAKLYRANLVGAKLAYTNLSRAWLGRAFLNGAWMFGADLSGANLKDAHLNGTHLQDADLSGANLISAYLAEASLVNTKLDGAIFSGAYFAHARYEPISVPAKLSLGGIEGLSTIKFSEGQQSGLVMLRTALKQTGLRELEREATYSIKHWKTTYAAWPERYLKRLFFEWTCGYGLYHGRPLLILLVLIGMFSFPYMIAFRRKGEDGIWKVWIPERVRKDLGKENPERLTLRGFAAFKAGLYFSLLSAFSIGWRELNVGNWIARIQRREYTLRASGWARTLSGIQSLLSVYLMALWVLTYFGRPFE